MQIGVDSQRAVENKRIFVIDNDDITATVLQFMLADDNETHVFAEIPGALEKARDWPPQLILLGSGLADAATVNNLKAALPAVKILLVGDAEALPPLAEAQARGANGLLPKPLKLEAVRRKVDGQLGRSVSLGIPVVQN